MACVSGTREPSQSRPALFARRGRTQWPCHQRTRRDFNRLAVTSSSACKLLLQRGRRGDGCRKTSREGERPAAARRAKMDSDSDSAAHGREVMKNGRRRRPAKPPEYVELRRRRLPRSGSKPFVSTVARSSGRTHRRQCDPPSTPQRERHFRQPVCIDAHASCASWTLYVSTLLGGLGNIAHVSGRFRVTQSPSQIDATIVSPGG